MQGVGRSPFEGHREGIAVRVDYYASVKYLVCGDDSGSEFSVFVRCCAPGFCLSFKIHVLLLSEFTCVRIFTVCAVDAVRVLGWGVWGLVGELVFRVCDCVFLCVRLVDQSCGEMTYILYCFV